MATVSNPATLSSVKSVFGGNDTLYNYRRGNRVPNLSVYSGVSTSTPVLSSFAGLIYPATAFPSAISLDDLQISPMNASTAIEFNADGTYDGIQGGSSLYSGTWLLAGAASNYQVRFVVNSGNNPTGSSLSTWLTMNSNIGWYLIESGDGYFSKALTATISFRDASTLADLGTCSVFMQSVVEV